MSLSFVRRSGNMAACFLARNAHPYSGLLNMVFQMLDLRLGSFVVYGGGRGDQGGGLAGGGTSGG